MEGPEGLKLLELSCGETEDDPGVAVPGRRCEG